MFTQRVESKYKVVALAEDFPRQLQEAFDEGYWKNAIQDINAEEGFEDEVPIRTMAQYEKAFTKFLAELKKHLKMKGSDLILYRAVNLVKELNKNKVGTSWTYKRESAVPYWGGQGKTHILTALVPPKAVELVDTIAHNVGFEGTENEINLGDNQKIRLIEITVGKKSQVVDLKVRT
jgi:hypothetical protein